MKWKIPSLVAVRRSRTPANGVVALAAMLWPVSARGYCAGIGSGDEARLRPTSSVSLNPALAALLRAPDPANRLLRQDYSAWQQ